MANEKILCAAIWYKELPLIKDFEHNFRPVNCDRGIVFCGHRHPHCLYSMCAMTGKRSVTFAEDGVGEHIQGFLTSKNRFVDREEALVIALAENQVIDLDNIRNNELHSEDLY